MRVPLRLHIASDPPRRRAVVASFYFDTSVRMHCAFAISILPERFQRQLEQYGLLFGKHRGNLSFGGAVDACVGPALFPVIEISLRLFEALESHALQRRPLG